MVLLPPDKSAPPPILVIFRGSDPRPGPSPAVPWTPLAFDMHIMSPFNAWVCFHPCLLPPPPSLSLCALGLVIGPRRIQHHGHEIPERKNRDHNGYDRPDFLPTPRHAITDTCVVPTHRAKRLTPNRTYTLCTGCVQVVHKGFPKRLIIAMPRTQPFTNAVRDVQKLLTFANIQRAFFG